MSLKRCFKEEWVQEIIEPDPFAEGCSRRVFRIKNSHKCHTKFVVKEVKNKFPGANMVEWIVWNSIRLTKHHSLFGRCVAISESGRYLIMENLTDLPKNKYADIPKIPTWMNDRKSSSFGISMLNGSIKIRDYGTLNLPELFKTSIVTDCFLKMDAQKKRKCGEDGW